MARRTQENESVDLSSLELVSFWFSTRNKYPEWCSVPQLWDASKISNTSAVLKNLLEYQYNVTPEPCQILRGRSDEPEPSCQSCLECVPSVPIVVICPSYPEVSRVSLSRFFSFSSSEIYNSLLPPSSFSPLQTCFGFLGCFDTNLNKMYPKSKHVFPLLALAVFTTKLIGGWCVILCI